MVETTPSLELVGWITRLEYAQIVAHLALDINTLELASPTQLESQVRFVDA